MIEDYARRADRRQIAKEAEFFSFGTNDLTQMTFGFSRDDAAKFLGAYYDHKIYESDPFQHLDQVGVGKLVKMAATDGRATRPDLGLGICGEHGGDPSSVEFCHNMAWTTSAALPSVCPSPVWHPLRLQLKTRGSKSYLSFDHDVTFCEASAWCKRADYPFRHSSWKDMTLSVNLDLN